MTTDSSQVLAELGLQDFEAEFLRLGIETLCQLAQVRYADLLQMGLSKVHCHLLLQKVSSLAGANLGLQDIERNALEGDREDIMEGASMGSTGGALEVVDIDDPVLAQQLADNAICAETGERGAADAALDETAAALLSTHAAAQASSYDEHVPSRSVSPAQEALAAVLHPPMPPPQGSSAYDALSFAPSLTPSIPPRSSRKRAHSSHLSTAVAHGSEQHSTVGSASGSSSSSLHMDIPIKKRRLADWSRTGYFSGSLNDGAVAGRGNAEGFTTESLGVASCGNSGEPDLGN